MSDIDWKGWFESWGEHNVGYSFTVEDLYQAFRERFRAEQPAAPPQPMENSDA